MAMAEGEGSRKLGVLCQHKILLMKLKENPVQCDHVSEPRMPVQHFGVTPSEVKLLPTSGLLRRKIQRKKGLELMGYV